MNKRVLSLIACFLLTIHIYAQIQTVITGRITDRKDEMIMGANIFLEDSYDGTSSGLDGTFTFTTAETGSHLLMCTYLGFQSFEKSIDLQGDTLTIEISLVENVMELQEIVISAGTFEAGGKSKREVLKPLDIVTTAGATADIAGALNTLPGTMTVGESGRLFVRGGEGYETKTFIDGVQVLDFYGPSAPNTPSRSRFLPFMFQGTSFSTGGYSAEYGQALSSALILNSKYIAKVDRVDISLLSVGADVSFTEAWKASSLSGKLQYTNIDPYFSLVSQEIDWVDPPTSLEGMAAYRTKLGEKSILKLYGNFNKSSFILNQADLLNPEISVRTTIKNQYAYFNATTYSELKNDWDLKTGFSYTDNQDNIRLNVDKVEQKGRGLHSKITLKKLLSSNFKAHFGIEYFRSGYTQDFHSDETNFISRYQFVGNIASAFVESDIQILPTLLARIGLRSEYTGLNRHLAIAPRVSVALKTGKYSQFAAAYGRFQQAPQNEWLMVVNNLENEKASHYIINYQLSGNGRTFRIEAFHKSYEELVKYDPEKIHNANGFGNKGVGEASGFDIFWRDSKSIPQVDYWISYSYLDSQRDYLHFPQKATPSFVSRHNFSAVYKHFISPLKTQLGWTYTFASGRTYEDPNQLGFLTQKTKSYHDLSLNLSYLLRDNIIIHASATNVFGTDQIFGYNFSEQPDASGHFPGKAIRPPATRFLFIGVFYTIAKEPTLNQLPNL